jgi:hypothetical protein
MRVAIDAAQEWENGLKIGARFYCLREHAERLRLTDRQYHLMVQVASMPAGVTTIDGIITKVG